MSHTSEIFKEVDNISHFIHPIFKQKFKYATKKESIIIANKVLNEIINSGYKTIIYSESGTSPLIYILKKLAVRQNIKIKFIPFKTPRDYNINLYEMIMFYLSKKEQEEIIKEKKRKDILYELCQININDYINKSESIYEAVEYKVDIKDLCKVKDAIDKTNISNIFKKKFIFFDEYVNAGTILNNFKFYAELFGANDYKIGSYCMFLDRVVDYDIIEFSIYNKKTELECYKVGAYPFENRIDLIGYYYFITENDYQKICLKKLKNEFKKNKKDTLNRFIDIIINKIEEMKILEKLKNYCLEKQVKEYLDNYDIVRYLFKELEKIIGKTKYYEYLDQLFELYAPAWSPMPVIFHLDYWQAFKQIDKEIEELIKIFKKEYMENRNCIFDESLKRFISFRKKYLLEMNRLLEDI